MDKWTHTRTILIHEELKQLYKLQLQNKEITDADLVGLAFVINASYATKLAIGGSLCLHLMHDNPTKFPDDIDLVTHKYEHVYNFIGLLQSKWQSYEYRLSIEWNHKTSFVQKPAVDHIRIQCPLCIPICIFVLPKPPKVFHYSCGFNLQDYTTVLIRQKELQQKRTYNAAKTNQN